MVLGNTFRQGVIKMVAEMVKTLMAGAWEESGRKIFTTHYSSLLALVSVLCHWHASDPAKFESLLMRGSCIWFLLQIAKAGKSDWHTQSQLV